MELEIPDEGVLAVVAHQLLNDLCVTSGSLALVLESWDVLPEGPRRHMIERAARHSELAVDLLGQLARGLPACADSATAA